MNYKIRLADVTDIKAIAAFDHVAQNDSKRIDFIKRTVNASECYVAESENQIVAYGVLNYYFYDQGMIDMLYVHADYRHKGLGTKLLKHFISICKTEKLFSSTNESNGPMRNLFEKEGFERSGVIYNLDEDDPELVYFKKINS